MDPPSIFPQPGDRVENLKTGARYWLVSWVVLLVLSAALTVWSVMGLLHDPIATLSNNSALYFLQLGFALALYFGTDILTWLIWCVKAERAAARGEYHPIRGHENLLMLVVLVNVFTVPAVHLSASDGGAVKYMVLPAIVVLVAMLLIRQLRCFLSRSLLKKKGRRAGGMTFGFVLSLLTAIFLCWTFKALADPVSVTEQGDAVLPVTAWKLTGRGKGAYLANVERHRSLWLGDSTYENYVPEGKQKEGAEPLLELYYRVVDVEQVSFTHDIAMNYLLGQGEYRSVDPVLWGCLEAWQCYEGNRPDSRYLLSWHGRLVVLDPDWLLTEEQDWAYKERTCFLGKQVLLCTV